jgi:hypothetical protein
MEGEVDEELEMLRVMAMVEWVSGYTQVANLSSTQ